jgi:hypothetical protein
MVFMQGPGRMRRKSFVFPAQARTHQQFVGWAKAHLRRAHHCRAFKSKNEVGGHACALPTLLNLNLPLTPPILQLFLACDRFVRRCERLGIDEAMDSISFDELRTLTGAPAGQDKT